MRLFEKAEGFDAEGGDEGVEVDLDDEPGLLLDFLNTWRKVITSSFWLISGLSHHIEIKLFDLLTSQLHHELISHNVMVEDLKKRIGGVF